MSSAIHQKSETFSIADAQRHIVDLLKPNPVIYWCDFLVTWCLGIFVHDCARRLSGQLWFSAEGLAPEGGWTASNAAGAALVPQPTLRVTAVVD